jgi:AraC family ethanolamine operon transcriptional activator
MRQDFCDFDELADTVHGWGLDWVQLDRGPLEATIHQISTPTAQFGRFRFSRSFHQRGTTPPGVRTFGLVGQRSPDVEWRGNTGTAAHILAFPADDLFEVISQPGFHGDTVSVSEDRIRSVAESVGLPDPFEGLPSGLAFVEIDPRSAVALRNAISRIHAAVTTRSHNSGDPGVLSHVELEIVAALVTALQSGPPADSSPPEPMLRARAIRTALDYIENHADEPPSVRDIYRASGVSWRTLDYAFRDRFGVTPKQYLQATRLQRVRHEILNSDPGTTILETAAKWGFWHMGQFAADYKRQFGELPSKTVRRIG